MNTIRSRLRLTLGSLASKELQDRYCVHGTKDEYLLPGELLGDSVQAVQFALSRAESTDTFSPKEIEALKRFLSIVNDVGPTIPLHAQGVSNAELVLFNAEWAQIREAAGVCLNTLGLEIGLDDLLRLL